MKKILILIITIFLTSGCYDYIELNDLSIISGVSVDYENDKYKVTYEILNDQKESQEASSKIAILVSGEGKNVSEAFNNAAKKTPKKPYYAHLKTLIISKEIASNKLDKLIDFFLRNTDIRSEFDTVIAENVSALDILKTSSKNNPVISELIESLLKNNKYYKNNTKTNPFEEMVTDILIFGEETEIPVVKKEKDKLAINGIGIFNNYELKGILTPNESITYNVLTNNATNATYTAKCGNDNLTFSIYNSKPKIEVTNKKININIDASASIQESNCNYNFKNVDVYKKLNKEYAKVIEKDIKDFIATTINYDSDILGIRRLYYKKYRKKNNDIWKILDYKINVDLKINKKGLIFEVEDDN